jgi:ribosomal-protein-alanine N-acetyltransferase
LNTLETGRLRLREFSADDSQFIIELLNEPSFIRNIGDRNVHNTEDAHRYLQNGPLASYAKNGFGLYAVILKETSELIGMCGLIKRDQLQDVDIGYAFLPRFWSKGYALEAVSAVKSHGRDVVGLKRLVAIVDPGNDPSIRVLEKIGMKFEEMVKLSEDDIERKLFATDL